MQKKIIALAVAGLSTAAFAQTNVTIYGVADVSAQGTNMTAGTARNYSATSGKAATGGAFGMKSNSSLIGFKGTEDLGNGNKALFQIETDVVLTGTNTSQTVNSGSFGNSGLQGLRDSYVGLNSKYGTVLGGFLSTPYRSSLTSFDVFPGATGDGRIETLMSRTRFGTGTGANTGYIQAASSARATAIAYAMPTLYGFNGSIAYTGSNTDGMTNTTSTAISTTGANNVALQSALSLNLGWEGYGVGIKGAFQQAKTNQTFTSGTASLNSPLSGYTSYLVGVQYTGLPGLKAGVVYNRNSVGQNAAAGTVYTAVAAPGTGYNTTNWTTDANKGSNNQIWVGASYRFGNNEPRVSYASTSNTNFNGGSAQDGAKQWNLGWGYYLSKRTQVYGLVSQIHNNANGVYNFASANTNLNPTGGQTLTTYGAGLRTNF